MLGSGGKRDEIKKTAFLASTELEARSGGAHPNKEYKGGGETKGGEKEDGSSWPGELENDPVRRGGNEFHFTEQKTAKRETIFA